ncbi:hypothetical protein BLNAU_4339 [Blattamonas nauphoetae]|uniref:Uncharacterized protein n=1 Tax=Blattamonas nauphoetae TaxID=2049346 RepID=A0ABQ9YAF1_9EUKA|nr:hypothetical protein BLNAU_4339 [Blattamonas nauphoetae]
MFSGPHSESPDTIDMMIELDCVQYLAVFCDLSEPEACPEELPELVLLLHVSTTTCQLYESSIVTKTTLPNDLQQTPHDEQLSSKGVHCFRFVIDCELIPVTKGLIKTLCHVDSIDSKPDDQWHIKESIDISWSLFTNSLKKRSDSLTSIVMSAIDDMEELTSLLVESRQKFQTEYVSDLIFLEKFSSTQYIGVIPLLEHDLLARLFSVQQPQTVPLSNTLFHLHLLSVITLFLESPVKSNTSKDQTRTTTLRIERILEVTKSYLVFILPKESFLEPNHSNRLELTRTITKIDKLITDLEDETQDEWDLITEQEIWETSWMTEVIDEETLEPRLENMNRRDEDMRENETDRWMLRRRRLGECGFEDALEARMATRGYLHTDDRFTMIHAMEKNEGLNFNFFEEDA